MPAGQVCDLTSAYISTLFQRQDDATTISTGTLMKEAHCVAKDASIRSLLPGSRCEADHQCRSLRCIDFQCRGQDHNHHCLTSEDCEPKYFCQEDTSTSIKTCQELKAEGSDCSDTTNNDCLNGYWCATVGTSTTN